MAARSVGQFDNEPEDIGISLFIRKLVVLEPGTDYKLVQPYNTGKFEHELSMWDIYRSPVHMLFHDVERAKEFASVLLMKAKYYD